MAQCVAPQNPQSIQAGETVRVAATAAASPQPPARAGLIKTAEAGTRDDVPPVMSAHPRGAGQQDHPRRGGTAMLLAALALMSGIALRRFGARDA